MAAIRGVPHPFPYQGSKRQLASQIVACIPAGTRRLVEPFAGSAAITLAGAYRRRAQRFLINDSHAPLAALWRAIIQEPRKLTAGYRHLWISQRGRERAFYDQVRDAFNQDHEPYDFLYLLARCVKAAVRYNGFGHFNNSPDNRRQGMHPDTMAENIARASDLLRGKAVVSCRDYKEVLAHATPTDVVYMDPPYQGVCNTRDHRYSDAVPFDQFVRALDALSQRGVPYIVSYDGRTGQKVHGRWLPETLRLTRLEIRVGRSTQATLLGRDDETFESLYLSADLLAKLGGLPAILRQNDESTLFATA